MAKFSLVLWGNYGIDDRDGDGDRGENVRENTKTAKQMTYYISNIIQ